MGTVDLPAGSVSASVNVFFEVKNVKNLQVFKAECLELTTKEVLSLPTKQLPLVLVNVSEKPSASGKSAALY